MLILRHVNLYAQDNGREERKVLFLHKGHWVVDPVIDGGVGLMLKRGADLSWQIEQLSCGILSVKVQCRANKVIDIQRLVLLLSLCSLCNYLSKG